MMVMKVIAPRLLALLALATIAPFAAAADDADVRCAADVIAAMRDNQDPDAGRNVRCRRAADGLPVPFQESAAGILTVRDADGDLLFGRTDSFGTTTFTPAPIPSTRPPAIEATPDGLGGAMFRDEAGRTYHPIADPMGDSTFYTDDGRILRCHTNDFGVTTCD